MTLITRLIAVLLFIFIFSFALKNTHPVALHLFLQYDIQAPLVLILLGFFLAGAGLGILAMTPTVFRHRREFFKSRAALDALQQTRAEQAQVKVTQPDIVSN